LGGECVEFDWRSTAISAGLVVKTAGARWNGPCSCCRSEARHAQRGEIWAEVSNPIHVFPLVDVLPGLARVVSPTGCQVLYRPEWVYRRWVRVGMVPAATVDPKLYTHTVEIWAEVNFSPTQFTCLV
jgi:hypothetical protein